MGAQFLNKSRLVTQVFKIESESWLRRIIENPYLGSSIPSRAAKNAQSITFSKRLPAMAAAQLEDRLAYSNVQFQ